MLPAAALLPAAAAAAWPHAVLGPANHNVLTDFLLPSDSNSALLASCFGGEEHRRDECCGAPPHVCFHGPGVGSNEVKPTHYHCCWEWRHPGSRFPRVYVFPSLESYSNQMGVKMSPRIPEALCIARASGILLRIYNDFAECVRSGRLGERSCLEATLNAAESEVSGRRAEADEESCGGATTGFATGWADIWISLRLLLQKPLRRLAHQAAEALETLNSYVWQLHHLQAGGKGGTARFRPAAAVLGAPRPVQGDLFAATSPHRGDVLLRLLQAAEASRRTDGQGLVFVELGTGQGDLARWLTLRAPGTMATMHIVDTFIHSEEGRGYDEERYAILLGGLQNLGLQRSTLQDGETVLHWPSFSPYAALGGFEIKIHRSSSLSAAQTLKDGSVDFVFVDAAHSYEDVTGDIGAWWPKLASGGCLAGHDFRKLDRAFWKVGGVREAVAHSFQRDVFLDSDTVWWTLK